MKKLKKESVIPYVKNFWPQVEWDKYLSLFDLDTYITSKVLEADYYWKEVNCKDVWDNGVGYKFNVITPQGIRTLRIVNKLSEYTSREGDRFYNCNTVPISYDDQPVYMKLTDGKLRSVYYYFRNFSEDSLQDIVLHRTNGPAQITVCNNGKLLTRYYVSGKLLDDGGKYPSDTIVDKVISKGALNNIEETLFNELFVPDKSITELSLQTKTILNKPFEEFLFKKLGKD